MVYSVVLESLFRSAIYDLNTTIIVVVVPLVSDSRSSLNGPVNYLRLPRNKCNPLGWGRLGSGRVNV